MSGRRWLSVLIVLGALAAMPATASAATETAALGNVTAQLSYEKGGLLYTNVRIVISRDGAVAVDEPAPRSPACNECPPGPAFGGKSPAVHIVQLDATPEPEVVIDLHTGGAHCCFYAVIFDFRNGAYARLTHDFGDPGYRLLDLDGDSRLEFRSGNPFFAYAFGAFAATRFPPQIWRSAAGQLSDVSRQFPGIIRADAKRLRRQFRKQKSLGVKPLLAAYVADHCLLGDCDKGFDLVNIAADKGFLKKEAKFRRHLRSFLKRAGYL